MSEKGSIKVSLGTVICIFIILILIAALSVVYYLGFIDNKEVAELKNQKEALETKIANNKEIITTENDNTITNDSKKDILRKDFASLSGYSFNMKVEDLTNELMKRFKSSNPEIKIETKVLSGPVDYMAIGWINSQDESDITGICIYYNNDYITSVVCTPAKYGSGDTGSLTIPKNLYEEAKKILGSETEEWKELEENGKIVETIYDVFTGEELKTNNFTAGMRKSLSISK